jgi:hypothetical protein
MVTENDISYRRTFQGAWALSAIVGGYREERQYMGYTKREASRLFRNEFNGKGAR